MNTRIAALALVVLSAVSMLQAGPEEDFDALFGPDARKAQATPDTRDDAELAGRMLSAARSVHGNAALQALLCEKAHALAIRNPAGDKTAVEALTLLAQAAPERKDSVRDKLIETYHAQFFRARGAEKQAAGEAMVDLLLAQADERLEGGSASDALALCRRALTVAAQANSPKRQVVQNKIKDITAHQVAYKRLEDLKARVKANPQDARARAELVRMLAFEFDKPAEAAEYLNADLDEALRTYLPLMTKPVSELNEQACLELGTWLLSEAKAAAKDLQPRLTLKGYLCLTRFKDLHKARDVLLLKAGAQLAEIDIKYPLLAKILTDSVLELTDLAHSEVVTYMPERFKPDCDRGGPLKLGGKTYSRGLALLPPQGLDRTAMIRYDLSALLLLPKRFRANIGIGDNSREGSLAFSIDVLRSGTWQTAYRSKLLRGKGQMETVDVAIAGAQHLRIVVSNGGDGSDFDYGWVCEPKLIFTEPQGRDPAPGELLAELLGPPAKDAPAPAPAQETQAPDEPLVQTGKRTPLTSLKHVELTVHNPTDFHKDKNYGGKGPIRIAGKAYATGLVLHARSGGSSIRYDLSALPDMPRRLTAEIGVEDSVRRAGSVDFAVEVLRNGGWQNVFASETIRGGQPAQKVDVDITGAKQLRLKVSDAGDGKNFDHAAWGDPWLVAPESP